MLGVSVSLDGWSADCDGYLSANNVYWKLQNITGWFDSPGVRANPLNRPAADGTYDSNPQLGSRTITLTGVGTAPDSARCLEAMDHASSLLTGSQRYGTLIIDEDERGMSRQATVRLGGQTLVQRLDDGRSFEWSMSLFAADPRRYSSRKHSVSTGRFAPGGGFTFDVEFDLVFGQSGSSGSVAVANAGSVATWPVLRFVGPLVNPVATLVGRGSIGARIELAQGQELVIDCGARTVLLDGFSRRSTLTHDDFFALEPGNSRVFFQADDGSGQLRVEWRDAW